MNTQLQHFLKTYYLCNFTHLGKLPVGIEKRKRIFVNHENLVDKQ